MKVRQFTIKVPVEFKVIAITFPYQSCLISGRNCAGSAKQCGSSTEDGRLVPGLVCRLTGCRQGRKLVARQSWVAPYLTIHLILLNVCNHSCLISRRNCAGLVQSSAELPPRMAGCPISSNHRLMPNCPWSAHDRLILIQRQTSVQAVGREERAACLFYQAGRQSWAAFNTIIDQTCLVRASGVK